jgi:hypothetical protein
MPPEKKVNVVTATSDDILKIKYYFAFSSSWIKKFKK